MKKILFLAFLALFTLKTYSQEFLESDEKNDNFRALWILNICNNVIWPNEDKIDTFKIAVFSNYKGVYNKLIETLKEKNIKNYIVKVDFTTNLKYLTSYNVIYLGFDKLSSIYRIQKIIENKPILIITDRIQDRENMMINIRPFDFDERRIEIDFKNLQAHNLKVTDQLIYHGGGEEELKGLYAKQKKELDQQIAELEKKKLEIAQLQKEMDQKTIELEKQKKLIEEKNKQLEELTNNLILQSEKMKENQEQLVKQEQLIKLKQLELAKQIEEQKRQQKILEEKNLLIKAKENELSKLNEKIKEAETTIKKATKTIETQGFIIRLIVGFSLIIGIITIFLIISLRKNHLMNIELRRKNEEITKQKNQIEEQAKLLELTNRELEKLSLVAEHAQNGVVIMDRHGNIEWVNSGFTKMYGYTLQLFINEVDSNIIGASANPDIKNIITKCITEKKPVQYEAKVNTRYKTELWVKTTLTPILDEKQEIKKIIAIDTDITALKEAYDRIENQHKIITQQNEKINSSIKYAKTIQNAILPDNELLSKYLEYELIFLPRDIVSGDFYWFHAINEHCWYAAVVDCTGHGVPGAFMSLIINTMLNEIILNKKNINPAEILNELEKSIKKYLKQDSTQNKDGADLSLIKYDRNKKEILFAGAKRNIYIYKKNQNAIMDIKSTKTSIGGIRRKSDIAFKEKSLPIDKEDIIYLMTDGFIDQNDEKRQKFGSQRFLEILNRIKELSLAEQKQILLENLNQQLKNTEQRDDITIWLMKIL